MIWSRRTAHRLRRSWWRLARPATRGARAILIDGSGRVCLVRHTYGSGWYLPGGGLRRGEEPSNGAIREVDEELGVQADLGDLLGVFTSQAEGKRDTVWVFTATTEEHPRPTSTEVAECAWFGLDELPGATSPATRRRLEEWAGIRPLEATW